MNFLPSNIEILLGKYDNYSMYNIHGIKILPRNNLFLINAKQHRKENVQSITITLFQSTNELNVCNNYARPNTSDAQIKMILTEIATCCTMKNTLYIVGYFNFYMSKVNTTKMTLIKHMQ